MNIDNWWIRTFKIAFAFQGFLLPITKITEPYFYKVLLKELRTGKKKKENERIAEQAIIEGSKEIELLSSTDS